MFMNTSLKSMTKSALRNSTSRLVNDEEGSMTMFGVSMLLMMLLVGGIGVDLMRNEMDRTKPVSYTHLTLPTIYSV